MNEKAAVPRRPPVVSDSYLADELASAKAQVRALESNEQQLQSVIKNLIDTEKKLRDRLQRALKAKDELDLANWKQTVRIQWLEKQHERDQALFEELRKELRKLKGRREDGDAGEEASTA